MYSGNKNYTAGFTPGKPYNGGCVALVRASKAEGYSAGDVVTGMLPWSSFSIVAPEQVVGGPVQGGGG
jgi:NADPH-dependent curcumin reductase CurA